VVHGPKPPLHRHNLLSFVKFQETQNAFLFPVHAIFRHDFPVAVKRASRLRRLVNKKTWRDSLTIDIILSAVSVLVFAQASSVFPGGIMNYPVVSLTSYAH
jgi:hypothetical protein